VSSVKIPSYLNLPGLQDLAGFSMPGNYSFLIFIPFYFQANHRFPAVVFPVE
jgi:hypothetical protein